MATPFTLEAYGITVQTVIRNAVPAQLYEEALLYDEGAAIASSGALMLRSGKKTGRSPGDKRVVCLPETENDIWWGDVNIRLEERAYRINHERAIDYLNTQPRLYVMDGYAGWAPEHRLKVRIVCSRPYHALFMNNMLIRPTEEELKDFGEPDFIVYNAGAFPANRLTSGMTSSTSVDVCFERKEMVILGTMYAGEMKKGVFTVMNYLMPKKGVLSMHCSCNQGYENGDATGDVSLFFGLSGTGKTTLSADANRALIGDDEHCWDENGVFNIEGGCYAKAIDLSGESEPEIFNAIRYGTVLENVVYAPETRQVDYHDTSITQNTRASYPIEFIDNAKIPCVAGHPSNVIFLTADAFGVLPPVAKLTPEQAMYHFISGYTAKVAGTEVGVTEPKATFSACFGAPFMVWHPSKYAELLAEKIERHGSDVWLVNTGWTGGPYGTGKRMSLKHTRAIIDAIHDGSLAQAPTTEDPIFGVAIPSECAGVPDEILLPRNTWTDKDAYDRQAGKLAKLFIDNFEQFQDGSSDAILSAAPQVPETA